MIKIHKKQSVRLVTKCFLCLIIFFSSCIESFRPELTESDQEYQLVVEGRLTNETGPFRVRLSQSGEVYTYYTTNSFEPVAYAEVHIFDDKGNDFKLIHVGNGWYETTEKSLQGTPGDTYTLKIIDPFGREYVSTPQLMLDVPPIEVIYYSEDKRTFIDEETEYVENWLKILLDTKVSGDNDQFFKWEFEETWKFEMPSYILVDHGMASGPIPNPPTMETVYIEDERKICWITESSKKIIVGSTVADQGNNINGFLLQEIGPSSDRLNVRYSMLVKQYALSWELYSFFKDLNEANEETDGIYSRIPGKISGNISTVEDGKAALGYFYASSVQRKRIFIDHSDTNLDRGSGYPGCGWISWIPRGVPVYFYGTYTDKNGADAIVWSTSYYCVDCRERGTKVVPDFWY